MTEKKKAPSPTVAQYREIKSACPGAVVLYQIGAFYEFFEDDALVAARVLGLKLAAQNKKKDRARQVPMCGVPVRRAERYVERLLELGYSVAVCSQVRGEDGKVLPQRRVERVYASQPAVMDIDPDSRRELEMEKSFASGTRLWSLVGALDATVTPLGKKLLAQWLQAPLADRAAIEDRLDAVEALVRDPALRDRVRDALKRCGGVEKRLAALSTNRGKPEDLDALAAALEGLPTLRALLEKTGAALFLQAAERTALSRPIPEGDFETRRAAVRDASEELTRAAQAVAEADVLASFAQVSGTRSYCRPGIVTAGASAFTRCRHPMVELHFDGGLYMASDWELQDGETTLVTGPDLSGKTTHLRAAALLHIMAQVGCFVAATTATVRVVRKLVYCREAADPAPACPEGTLVILDETADPATAERALRHLAAAARGKAILATRFRETGDVALREALPVTCRKMWVAVDRRGPIFYHRLLPGVFDFDIDEVWEKEKQKPRKVWR